MDLTTVLSAVAVLFVHLLFALAMLNTGSKLWLMSMYIAVVPLYAAVYLLGRRDLRLGLRRRLRNAAVALAVFISASIFYHFAAGMPWWAAIAVCLGFAVVGYLLYDVIMPEPNTMDEAVPVRTRPPV